MEKFISSSKIRFYTDPYRSTADPLDMHREIKRRNIQLGKEGTRVVSNLTEGLESGTPLNIGNWLKGASTVYDISPNLNDYVIKPVIILPSELPNRNGVGFPIQELIRFNPEMGMCAYKTFQGKPTHYEHANTNIKEAKGVIFDTFIRKLEGFGNGKLWKVLALLGWDRQKDPKLANRVLTNDLNTFSMGAWIDLYTCSVCGREMGKCYHLDAHSPVNFKLTGDGQLAFCEVYNPVGFETSGVEGPAFLCALSDETRVLSVNPELRRS